MPAVSSASSGVTFGAAVPTSSSGFAFGQPATATTSSGFTFGNATPATTLGFSSGATASAQDVTSPFGATTPASAGFAFGATSTTTVGSGFAFGNTAPTATTASGCGFNFGTPAVTTTSTGFAFGNVQSSSTFSGFGASTTSAFGSLIPSSTTSTATTASGGGFNFVMPAVTTISTGFAFGNTQSGFGAPATSSETPAFGTSPPSSTTSTAPTSFTFWQPATMSTVTPLGSGTTTAAITTPSAFQMTRSTVSSTAGFNFAATSQLSAPLRFGLGTSTTVTAASNGFGIPSISSTGTVYSAPSLPLTSGESAFRICFPRFQFAPLTTTSMVTTLPSAGISQITKAPATSGETSVIQIQMPTTTTGMSFDINTKNLAATIPTSRFVSNKHWGEIGRVVPSGQDTFLWQIPEFPGLLKEVGASYWSPIMILSESEWSFEICPNGEKDVADRILLILQRWDDSCTKTHCLVAVRHADGVEEPVGTDTILPEENYAEFFLRPFSMYADKSEDASTLTITVCLREEGKAVSQIPTSRVRSRHGEEIGHVVPRGQDTFLWEIPELSGLPKEVGTKCLSPIIELPNSAWRFEIHLNVVGFATRRPLRLWRWDNSQTKTHCTVAVRRANGKEEPLATNAIMPDEDHVQYFGNPFYRCADECEEGGGLSPGTHTLIVCLREEGEAASQGGALISREIQMEDLSSAFKSQDESNEGKSSPLEATVPTSRVSPKHGGEIGHIVPRGQDTFVWEIPGFLGLPKKVGTRYRSPVIELRESDWSFEIYPNGEEGFADRILLSLWRWDDSLTKIHCTVSARHVNGKEEQVGTDTILPDEDYVEYFLYADKCEDASILSSGTLTIIACLREEVETATQGRAIISQETQTEDLSSANKNKDDSDEVESSHLKATDRTSISEATQTDVENLTDKVDKIRKNNSESPEAKIYSVLKFHTSLNIIFVFLCLCMYMHLYVYVFKD